MLVLLAVSASVFAQTEKQITTIRAEVAAINKAAVKYDKKTKLVEGISLEGTEATYFTSGHGLKKITAKMYGETFRATAELFYSGEELLFAYRRVERYDTQIGMKPPPKVVGIIETRVYYAGARAIRVIEGKKQVASTDIIFTEAEMEITELSDMLKAGLDR